MQLQTSQDLESWDMHKTLPSSSEMRCPLLFITFLFLLRWLLSVRLVAICLASCTGLVRRLQVGDSCITLFLAYASMLEFNNISDVQIVFCIQKLQLVWRIAKLMSTSHTAVRNELLQPSFQTTILSWTPSTSLWNAIMETLAVSRTFCIEKFVMPLNSFETYFSLGC